MPHLDTKGHANVVCLCAQEEEGLVRIWSCSTTPGRAESWDVRMLGILGKGDDMTGHSSYRHQRNQGIAGDLKGVLFDLRLEYMRENVKS